jgi:flagellar protein FliJ
MAQPFSLQLLLELTQDKTDEATRKLGLLIAEETGTRERLKLLENYRTEYLEKFRAAQANGLTTQAWQNYLSFISRLDEAVAQQTRIVESAANKTAQGQKIWIDENRQMKALDTLSQRHQQKEMFKENKAEQKMLDEFSARKHTLPKDQN